MKFAKQLALRIIPTWSDYYIDYRTLKKYLKETASKYEENGCDPLFLKSLVDEFRQMLMVELEKVNTRYINVEAESSSALDKLNEEWHKGMSDEEYGIWRNNMLKVLSSLESLKEFTQTNITGFQKILKKFDKYFYNTSTTEELKQLSTKIVEANQETRELYSPQSIHGKFVLPEPLLHRIAPPSRTSTMSPSNNLNRYAFTPIGKELWSLVTSYKFVTSERDETLLSKARQIWRKRVPLSPAASPLAPLSQDLTHLSVEETSIPTVMSLDLETLPHGQVSYLWVVLAEDGMCLPIKVPVIVAKGVKVGPIVGLTAALHGNELNGIPLIHRLISQELNPGNLHGIVVACPVANVPGYLSGQRTFSDGTDLNRLMPGKQNGSTSQTYAYNLVDRIVSKFTHLLDLHTASKGRANSLYIIVHNTSPDGSLRGAAMERGIPAITVEIGDPSTFQKRFVKHALQGVTNILSNLKMIPGENLLPEYDPVICSKSYWIFCKRGGILNVLPDVNTWVKKNEPIATLHSVFGNLVETYYAPEDGIVIGKEMDPVCQSGQRILHLGVVMDKFEAQVDDGHL
ncbi:2914_t:CDS:10 [Ambispora leptoticha]|uniref:2914_t:CDS:1 n=1 Tax=Ambispora leptoticha TaxID=144679 RepID=A0A9N9F8D0_9GLOM|nr:2914_t:CDS:10 [Ambispora leptoticha]